MVSTTIKLLGLAALLCLSACDSGTKPQEPSSERAPGLYSVRWATPVVYDEHARARPAFSSDERHVYTMAADSLRAFDLDSGAPIWKAPLGRLSYGTAILSDAERIYYNTARWVGAWHHDGTLAWGGELGADFEPGAAHEMLQDASRLYVSGWSELVAIDKTTGQIVYRVDLPPGPNAEPATSHVPPFRLFYPGDISDDGLLYLPSQHFTSRGDPVDWSRRGETGTLFCIEAATGEVRWQYEAPTYMDYEPAIQDSINHTGGFVGVAVGHERVFINAGAYLIALDRHTGDELWRYTIHDGGFNLGKTVSTDGELVYVGTISGYVMSFSTATGEKVWDHRVHTSVTSWPSVIHGSRLFFVHGFGNGLFVYKRRTGEVLLDGADPPDQDELASEGIQSYYWTAPAIARETVVMGGPAGVYALHVGPPK